MRERFVVANWKVNKTCQEAQAYGRELKDHAANFAAQVRCIIAPPATALMTLRKALGDSPVQLCAQNIYPQDFGAFTGEVSAPLVAEAGASYTLVGHSERRALCAETSEHTALKLQAAARSGLCPILCVGESAQDRASGSTFDVVNTQLRVGCEAYLAGNLGPLMVAYEPLWAIGTGKTPEPKDCEAVHQVLATTLRQLTTDRSQQVPLLYGGSVTAANVAGFVAQPHVDGVLVGGASLKLVSLLAIVAAIAP